MHSLTLWRVARARIESSDQQDLARKESSCLAFLLAILLLATAPVQAATVDLVGPRAFGYFLGDIIHHEAVITLDPGFRLEPGALPRTRSVTYWLDLRDVALAELPTMDGGRRYRLSLTYQTFYAALEPRPLVIPAVPLTARDGERVLNLSVPAWTFVSTPLREVFTSHAAPPLALQSDILPEPNPVRRSLAMFAVAAVAAFVGVAVLAWLDGWGPLARRHLPFTVAARQMHKLLSGPDQRGAYKSALLALHRAFDAAANRRLLADDLRWFMVQVPLLAPEVDEIADFFSVSRIAFFGDGADAAMTRLSPDALLTLARRLRTAEREGRTRLAGTADTPREEIA